METTCVKALAEQTGVDITDMDQRKTKDLGMQDTQLEPTDINANVTSAAASSTSSAINTEPSPELPPSWQYPTREHTLPIRYSGHSGLICALGRSKVLLYNVRNQTVDLLLHNCIATSLYHISRIFVLL